MLGVKGILSFSPELGIYHYQMDNDLESFYPTIEKAYEIVK